MNLQTADNDNNNSTGVSRITCKVCQHSFGQQK